MLGALWWLQRRLTKGAGARGRGAARRGEGIQVISRQGIGAKAQLVVVDVEGTRYVLGVTEQGVSVIDRIRAASPSDEAPGSDVVTSFERLLAEAAQDTPAQDTPAPGSPAPTPALRRDRRASATAADPLAGSILSPATWRQTAQALGLRR